MARKRKSDRQLAADAVIGRQIERVRERRGISVKELARRLRVSYQAVYNYETGRIAVSAARLIDIARALDCDLKELVPITSII